MHNQQLELADVFKAGFTSYCREHGPLPALHYTVANAIMACHTASLGGHVFRCDRCGHNIISYNSCRNRHCPSCQARARARWVDARTKELLPVPYFHVVFTIPSQLNPFALRNKEVFYNILFKAASQTLIELGMDPKRLGAQLGFVALLHTWGQNLMDHPHLHCIVPGGGLDDDRWVPCASREFLFPVKVIAALFRGKVLDLFKTAIDQQEIVMHGALACFRDEPQILRDLISDMYETDWVVYAKPPFASPQAVIKYLGRYTHRIAISNRRIITLTDTHVSFRWKDYADNNREKIMTLTIQEFIRRFLLHIIPSGFVRIRYYGFLSARARKTKLQLCRDQTATMDTPVPLEYEAIEEAAPEVAIQPPSSCPVCHTGHMQWHREIHKSYPGGLLAIAA